MNDWKEIEGRGWARYGGDISGIPLSKKSWIYTTQDGGFDLGTFVFSNDFVFLVDGRSQFQAVDINTGSLVWLGPKSKHYVVSLSVGNGYLMAGSYVLDQNSGEIITDISEDSGYEFEQPVIPFRFNDLIIQKGSDNEYVVYDVTKDQYSTIESRFNCWHIGWMPDFGGIGLNEKGIVYLDLLKSKVYWEVEIPNIKKIRSICHFNHYLYFSVGLTVYKISVNSGEIVWQTYLPDDCEHFKNTNTVELGVSEDAFYIMTRNYLHGYSTETGKPLWHKQLLSGVRSCIVGDLVFGIDLNRITAWDRYSGDVVWEADKKIEGPYTVKSASGKLFVNTGLGELHCFEWNDSEPYQSPSKPNWI